MWFKVDDQLHSHAKAIAAGNQAMGLWVRLGSWCSAHLTDGKVTHEVVELYEQDGEHEALVLAGWLEPNGAEGYILHDYLDYQPSRKQAEALKKTRAKAGRKGGSKRQANAKQSESKEPSKCEAKGTGTGTGKNKKKVGPMPADWHPNGSSGIRARDLGLTLCDEATDFREWTTAKGAQYADWDAAFLSHLRRRAQFRKDRTGESGAQSEADHESQKARIAAEYRADQARIAREQGEAAPVDLIRKLTAGIGRPVGGQ